MLSTKKRFLSNIHHFRSNYLIRVSELINKNEVFFRLLIVLATYKFNARVRDFSSVAMWQKEFDQN